MSSVKTEEKPKEETVEETLCKAARSFLYDLERENHLGSAEIEYRIGKKFLRVELGEYD